MQTITLETFLNNQDFYISEAKAGKIFIYPTDTIYGIWAVYTEANKDKIFQIKHRDTKKMFSIIAPSFERITENYTLPTLCHSEWNEEYNKKLNTDPSLRLPAGRQGSGWHNTNIDIDQLKTYLNTYHGVTYIFSYTTPGVRIIKHPIQDFVQSLGEPFITTSCNIAWEPPLQNLKDISSDLKSQVDYIIDGWILGGRPSVLIDLVANKIIER